MSSKGTGNISLTLRRVVPWLVASSLVCSMPIGVALVTSPDAQRVSWENVPLALLEAFVVLLLVLVVGFVGMRRLMRARALQGCAFFTFTRAGILFPALIMLCFWSVYLVALAPGTMGWDTTFQISQCYPNHGAILSIPWGESKSYVDCQFSDHHPVFVTMLFGLFALPSDALTGSWNLGLTLYIVLQAIAMSLTLSALCAYVRKLGCPAIMSAIALGFFCLLPMFPINAATIVKDTLFTWLFVLYALIMFEVARTKGAALDSKRMLAALLVVSALVVLSKKTGLYIVVPVSMLYGLVFRERFMRMMAPAIEVLALMVVILPHVVFPLINAIPGGKQEALGTLFQQSALVVAEHGSELTEEERAAIDGVIVYDDLEDAYDPRTVDPVKFLYRWDTAGDEEVSAYMRVWVQEGLRYPDTYFRAAWMVVQPFFDPSARIDVYRYAGGKTHGCPQTRFYPATKGLRTALLSWYDTLKELPVVGMLCSNVLYAWIIPIATFFAVLLFDRRAQTLLPFSLVTLVIASLLISPAPFSRYMYPLLYLAPLLVALASHSLERDN